MSQIAVSTAKVKVYSWTCDRCGKTLKDQSQSRLISNKEVHLGMHRARQEKAKLKISEEGAVVPAPTSSHATDRPVTQHARRVARR